MSQTKKPSDFTGRQAQKLAAENADKLAARAKELSTIQAAEVEAIEGSVVDVTGPVPEVVVLDEVVLNEETRLLRVNEALENVTFGAGNHYTFEVGREYKVPVDLYDHLDDLGYVWH